MSNKNTPITETIDVVTLTANPILNPYGYNMLCLQLEFNTATPVTYTYTVSGRTPDTNFTYQNKAFHSGTFKVDMVGLVGNYSEGNWSIDFTNAKGHLINRVTGTYDTSTLDYGPHLLHIDIDVLDEDMAESTINNGWLFIGYYNDAYDKNGDLRVCGLGDFPVINNTLKIHDNCLYIAVDYDSGGTHNKSWLKVKLTGEIIHKFTAPEGFYYHHDITWDEEGHFYTLGTPEFEDEQHKLEGILYKYIDATGELITSRDYSSYFYQSSVLKNSPVNDCHLNSLDYIHATGEILLNSRNTSCYFTVDRYALLPIWVVDNPAHPLLFDARRNLTVGNSDKFIYPNGEHAVFVTHNQKYQSHFGNGRFVLSLFDNESCRDENGNDIEKLNEDSTQENAGYLWDSATQIVEIDLNKQTVTQLDRFIIPGQRSHITSSVFDTVDKKYLQVFYGVGCNFFVIDTNGNIGVAAYNLIGEDIPTPFPVTYRAKVFLYSELHQIL